MKKIDSKQSMYIKNIINRIKKNNLSFFIILFGLLFSIFISNYNLNKYDKIVFIDNSFYHQMIKTDSLRYLGHGAEIKKEVEEGKSYFKSGRESYTKYLPPRIAAAYYYFFDLDLYDNFENKMVNTGIHFFYLLFQCLFYFFSVWLLYQSIKNIFSNKVCFFIICFLCIEPTIFQYHGTFWSESYFFSLQVIIISLVLKNNPTYKNYYLLGFFIGILSLQKQMAIFYIIPIIFYFFIFLKEFRYKKILIILIGFITIQLFLAFHNFQRSGKIYIMTADTKLDLHRDFVEPVIAKKNNISRHEFGMLEGKISLNWINDNLINFDKESLSEIKNPTFMQYRTSIKNEKDKIKFDNFISLRTVDYMLKNPSNFISFGLKKSLHIILLNPFHIYSDHNFPSGELFYETEEHDKLIPYRIVYSLLIYLICFYGLVVLLKNKSYKLLFFLFFSALYFFGLVSWHGNTRYFVPVMIYLSFFFGFGLDSLIKKKFFIKSFS